MALTKVTSGVRTLGTDEVVAANVDDDAIITASVVDNAITLAKLEDGTQGDILYYGASGAPTRLGFGTTGDFLKTQGTGANPVWATISGGLSDASTWRLTDNFTGDANPISSNLSVATGYGYGSIGSAMTESSGVFTFPSTGFWWILLQGAARYDAVGANSYCQFKLQTTTNDATYSSVANCLVGFTDETDRATSNCSFLFDVTSTSTHKVSFRVDQGNTSNVVLGDTQNATCFTFLKFGDT
jgi:hypothetical protein